MKLKQEAINSFITLLTAAGSIGVEKLIISKDLVRGLDEKKTVGILSTTGSPDIEDNVIAVNRVKELLSRLKLVGGGEAEVSATFAGTTNEISMLELAGKKSKTQFRCASIESIKGVPKGFSDPAAWKVTLTGADISNLAQTQAAMDTDTLLLTSRDGTKVSAEFINLNKDTFALELDGVPSAVGTQTSFAVKYWSKALMGLLREAAKVTPDVTLTIGAGGLSFVNVGELVFFTVPSTQ